MRPARLTIMTMLLFVSPLAGAAASEDTTTTNPTPPDQPTAKQLAALDRDSAAAEAAAAKGDIDTARRYVDLSGHEQEALARAMLEYGAAQASLRKAVIKRFGDTAWREAARTLRMPERSVASRSKRRVRLAEGVLYVKQQGVSTETPYVNVEGVWKLSVRDVVYQAIKGALKDRPPEEIEEATLFGVAGKIAKVLQGRAQTLTGLADAVASGKFESVEQFNDAVANVEGGRVNDAK